MMRESVRRAQPPRPPALSVREQRSESARMRTLRGRLQMEQRSLLRGLVLLAIVVLIFSVVRGRFDQIFVPAWWRQW